MKRFVYVLAAVLACVWSLQAAELSYTFPPAGATVSYAVTVAGDLKWGYMGRQPRNFKLNSGFLLDMTTVSETSPATLKLSARRSKLTIDKQVVEDTTDSETRISDFIPEMLVQLDKTGKFASAKYLKPTMLEFMPFLNLFPVFPGKISEGISWKQSLPSFNLMMVWVPELEFTYTSRGLKNGMEQFDLLSNQLFNQERRERGAKFTVTGKNALNGVVFFDPTQGLPDNAKGVLNLQLNYMFTVPDAGGKKNMPVPLTLLLNLEYSFTRVK